MNGDRTSRLGRRLGWATLVGGALVVLFWALYLAGAGGVRGDDQLLGAFESAFIGADALLATMLFGASRALFTGERSGPFLLSAAGAMTLYLGLLDVTFYVRHGLYGSAGTPAAAIQLLVHGLCIGGGGLGLLGGWRLWRGEAR